MDLVIKIAMLYNYEPMEVVKKTASAVRRLMLQWAAVPSSVRWGRTRELLRVENISFFSGGKPVLRGISMSAMRGEIIGLVGEGRRALILAIAGLFKPTSGSVTLDGIDTYSRRSEIKDSIGLLLNRTELYGQFSSRWNLLFLGKLDGNVDKNTINDLLEKYNLTQHADKKASNLNQEIKRKLMIVQALIKRPSLLLLEEPLAGLKDQEAKGIEVLLKNLSRWEGLTIICTGRNAQELTFCNKILSLKKGTVEAVIETERQEIG
jgi:ABC-2 type transport system ATP-binding protein